MSLMVRLMDLERRLKAAEDDVRRLSERLVALESRQWVDDNPKRGPGRSRKEVA